MTKTKHSL